MYNIKNAQLVKVGTSPEGRDQALITFQVNRNDVRDLAGDIWDRFDLQVNGDAYADKNRQLGQGQGERPRTHT